MGTNNLVRIEKKVKNGIHYYQIFGLNIFTANTDYSSELKEMQGIPFLKFISRLVSSYETISLIGSPAPENWINEMKRQGKKASIQDFLGKETTYRQVPVWYYGGDFGGGEEYGPSIIFKLRDNGMLKKLIEVFMVWDAVALLMYEKGKDGLALTKNSLRGLTTQDAIIQALLQEAKYLLISQADCQYLEVYTRANDISDELKIAVDEAVAHIISTDWYKANKDNLAWDEQELSYVRHKS